MTLLIFRTFYFFSEMAIPATEPSPEPETTAEPKSEPKTIMPEILTNQETFLMYGVFIFALFVFCIVLLVLVIILRKK